MFSNHRKKFDRALKELPKEFRSFYPGIDLIIPSTLDETKVVGSAGEKILRITATTGSYQSTDKTYTTDFDVRKDCFFVGWDNENRLWKHKMEIINEDLTKFTKKLQDQIKLFEKNFLPTNEF